MKVLYREGFRVPEPIVENLVAACCCSTRRRLASAFGADACLCHAAAGRSGDVPPPLVISAFPPAASAARPTTREPTYAKIAHPPICTPCTLDARAHRRHCRWRKRCAASPNLHRASPGRRCAPDAPSILPLTGRDDAEQSGPRGPCSLLESGGSGSAQRWSPSAPYSYASLLVACPRIFKDSLTLSIQRYICHSSLHRSDSSRSCTMD